MHIARFYLALELRGAAHARLVAPSLAIPLGARLSVSRSAARRSQWSFSTRVLIETTTGTQDSATRSGFMVAPLREK